MSEPPVSAAPPSGGARVYEIDLLRFVAAMAVVLYHWTFRGAAADGFTTFSHPGWAPVWRYGYLGVHLFFLISGFVILMTALHGGDRPLWRFFVSRATRLYPAYWVCCTLTAAAIWWAADPRYVLHWSTWLANLTMLNGFFGVPYVDGVYWSLLEELRFYLLVAVVLALGGARHAEKLLWAWLVVAALLLSGRAGRLEPWVIAPFAGLFIGGAACYLVHARGATASRLALVALSLGVALVRAERERLVLQAHYDTMLSPWVVGAVVAGCYAVMLAVSLGWTRALRWSGWVALGALTYPLYLLHQTLGYLAFNRWAAGVDPGVVVLLALAVALVLAHAVHRWVERPLAPAMKRGLERLRVAAASLRGARRPAAS